MKKTISLIFALWMFNRAYAQNTKIEIDLYVKGEQIELKNGIKISVINKNDTLELQTLGSSFFLPDSLNMKRRDFLLKAGGYSFYFDERILTFQPLLPKWEIFYDYKPFLEENKSLLKMCNHKVKSLYTLNYNTGTLFTYYNRKKLKPSN